MFASGHPQIPPETPWHRQEHGLGVPAEPLHTRPGCLLCAGLGVSIQLCLQHPAVPTASSCAYSILHHGGRAHDLELPLLLETLRSLGQEAVAQLSSCSALLFPAPHAMPCLCIHGDTPWDPGSAPGAWPLCTSCAPGPGVSPAWLLELSPPSLPAPSHGIMKSLWLAEITKSNIPPNTPVPTDPWPEVTHLPMSGSFPDPPIPCSLLCLLFLWFLPHSVPWAIPFLTTNSWLLLPSFNSGFSIHLLSLSWLPPLSPRMLSLTSLCCPRPCQGMPITPGGELAPC